MTWTRSLGVASLWAIGGLIVLVPVAVITGDRLLPWGGIATLGWGPPLVGLAAGLVHRDAKVGVLTALAVLVLGVIAFVGMLVLAMQSLPGP
jgi:hypothetical protein